MRALLVHPEFPLTYWGFQYALPVTSKKASLPPLGMISLGALLPEDWQLRLVDLNIEGLRDEDLRWAEVVLVGGMHIQIPSMLEVLKRARALGKRTVVGGPSPSTTPATFAMADVVFQGEAEGRIPELLAAIQSGKPRLLSSPERPSMELCPTPRFDLLKAGAYAAMSMQYSRGCPFRCEFCDIIEIYGRIPRVKSEQQVLAELDAIAATGHKGRLFIVDDNFIGNLPKVRALLPRLQAWQERHEAPFEFFTEASVNLASDKEMTAAMVKAGFTAVFLGIETPSPAALKEAGKMQNIRLDLWMAVDKLARAGLEPMAGFIVGFDADTEESFQHLEDFIATNPIPRAMVGILTALPGTALSRRLEKEGRLRSVSNGDQFNRPNFQPKMDELTLLRGYARLQARLFDARAYYARCRDFLTRTKAIPGRRSINRDQLVTLSRALWMLGVVSPRRWHFWRLLLGTLLRRPGLFGESVGQAVVAEHMIRYTQEEVLPRLQEAIAEVEQERQAPPRVSPRADLPSAAERRSL